MQNIKLKFDYMNEDNVCSSVIVYSDNTIECCEFIPEVFRQVFGKRPHTMENLYKFFECRCIPRTHFALKESLASLGLTQYTPYDIVKITHGIMVGDDFFNVLHGNSLVRGCQLEQSLSAG